MQSSVINNIGITGASLWGIQSGVKEQQATIHLSYIAKSPQDDILNMVMFSVYCIVNGCESNPQ